MGILETLKGKLGLQSTASLAEQFQTIRAKDGKRRQEALVQPEKRKATKAQLKEQQFRAKKEARVSELGQRAEALFTPALEVINETFANNEGEITLFEDVEAGEVALELKWGGTLVDRYVQGAPVARSGYGPGHHESSWESKNIHFALKRGWFGLSAEFGSSPTNKIKFNPTEKNWEQRLARQIYSIANTEASRYIG